MSQFEEDREAYWQERFMQSLWEIETFNQTRRLEKERKAQIAATAAAAQRTRRMQRWYWRAWYAIKEKP